MKAILAALALLAFQAWHSHSGVSRPWDFFCLEGWLLSKVNGRNLGGSLALFLAFFLDFSVKISAYS